MTGWLAVGALLGMYDFWHAAGQARVDMVFSASVTAAIAGFYFWYRKSVRNGAHHMLRGDDLRRARQGSPRYRLGRF
jgi:4-amino-4-deoxy-L-arabinose transferase-like glycosyltransferase